MTAPRADQLITDYLFRLERALMPVPSARRVELVNDVRTHIAEARADQVARAVHALRGMELVKPPGVAESLDWARALRELDREVLDAQTAAATLGAVVKYHEDLERVARAGLDRLLAG